MTPSFHPSDATLFDYGGGALSEPLGLAVATHIALCAECRDKLATIEAVGGALLDDLVPQSLADDAFAKTLARLGGSDAVPTALPSRAPVASPLSVGPLRRYTKEQLSLPWRSVARGVSMIDLLRRHDRRVRATLFRVAPGTVLPLHGHNGREMTVVLEGGFSDETGSFTLGDFIEHDSGVTHRPAVDTDEDCVCLIAFEGRLRFTGLFGRFIPLFVDM